MLDNELSRQSFLFLMDLNKEWFELHKHLSTDEMVDVGLIDEEDRWWVDKLRQNES